MSKSVQKYLKENLDKIIKIGIVYIIGVVIGMIIFNVPSIKENGVEYVKSVLDLITSSEFEKVVLIQNGIKNNLLFMLLLYSSILTIICPLVLVILMFLKGVLNGIYFGSLFSIFGVVKGTPIVLGFGIFPTIILSLSFIVICINIMEIISTRKLDVSSGLKHIYVLAVCMCLMCFSMVIEQLMCIILTNGYTSI